MIPILMLRPKKVEILITVMTVKIPKIPQIDCLQMEPNLLKDRAMHEDYIIHRFKMNLYHYTIFLLTIKIYIRIFKQVPKYLELCWAVDILRDYTTPADASTQWKQVHIKK
jgi:hypothetical protein